MRLCLGCHRPVTGQQALAALGRMVEAGMTVAEAKARSPSCFACARRSAPEKTKQTRCGSRERNLVPPGSTTKDKQEEVRHAATNR
jgi:hypothetical protein